jgi:hypothetical protein
MDFITSCCGKAPEDCPGCPGGMELIPKNKDEEKEVKENKHPIFVKIEEGTVTTDDFNQLIAEAAPESLRDRMRRRPMAQRRSVRSHQDNETGHARTEGPTFRDRIQPKRERADRTQMQGRGKSGHRHSARSQRGKPQDHGRFTEAVEFVTEWYGKSLGEYQELLAEIEDKAAVAIVARRLMSRPGMNRDWLQDIVRCVEHGR